MLTVQNKLSAFLVALYALLTIVLPVHTAHAHQISAGYIVVQGPDLHWEVTARDLNQVYGLDADGDGSIRWSELEQAAEGIQRVALDSLSVIGNDGKVCDISANGDVLLHRRSLGTFVSVPLRISCVEGVSPARISDQFLFDVEPARIVIGTVSEAGSESRFILRNGAREATLSADSRSIFAVLESAIGEGIVHIGIGYDHIAFLISLLIPAVLTRRNGSLEGEVSRGAVIRSAALVVSAFTLAHSLTLALASLKVVEIPSWITESVIAASVVFTCAMNVFGLVGRSRFIVAFGFGLIHGFGFASVLSEDVSTAGGIVTTLVGFNIGVEIGQLAILTAVLPVLYAFRNTRWYRPLVLRGGSAALGCIAVMWLLERVSG